MRQSFVSLGVDVILDKWDLKEGHDAVVFMEQMVNNPEIKKVAIICDQEYAAKADERAGGVGTETQIISKEIYENQDQEKFVAVVCEKDIEEKPILPTYYRSRIYIDLSDVDRYADNFEQLLRWIFDKPLYVKPKIGSRPSFLSEGDHVSLGTTAIFRRCVDAIRNQKAYAEGAFDEYCNMFATNFERFRLSKPDGEFDDAVVKSIGEFLPYRNEAIQLFITVAQYAPSEEFSQRLHRLFEDLFPFIGRPEDASQWRELDSDNYKFLVHELFLYAMAIFLKFDRLDQANCFLQQQYYLKESSRYGKSVMVNFTALREYMPSLEHRNKRLGLGRLSVRADLLKERCAGTGIDFRYLLQADFVAFMRAQIEAEVEYDTWWPETLVYLGNFNSPLEIFARSASRAYFDKAKVLLAIETPKDLEPLLNNYRNGSRELPRWEFKRFSPASLLGYEHLATRP